MLLPGGIPIIFELDDRQHYSEEGKAVPRLYAKMVKCDREMRLKDMRYIVLIVMNSWS